MTAAAEALDVDVRDLDRAIWLHESDANDDSQAGAHACSKQVAARRLSSWQECN